MIASINYNHPDTDIKPSTVEEFACVNMRKKYKQKILEWQSADGLIFIQDMDIKHLENAYIRLERQKENKVTKQWIKILKEEIKWRDVELIFYDYIEPMF